MDCQVRPSALRANWNFVMPAAVNDSQLSLPGGSLPRGAQIVLVHAATRDRLAGLAPSCTRAMSVAALLIAFDAAPAGAWAAK